MVTRYNMYPAAADQRQRGPRHQFRPGIGLMERIARERAADGDDRPSGPN